MSTTEWRCQQSQHPTWLRYGVPCAECEWAQHEIVHRNPIGEAVCSCGQLFEHGTLTAYWDSHLADQEAER